MFSTLIAILALVAFVLPGFVASRIARGRRAAPASLGDLELGLIALGYALVIHAVLAGTGWTGSLFKKVEPHNAWTSNVWEVLLWAGAALILAVILGLVLHWAFDALAGEKQPVGWRLHLFHALGGQDVRDGFDYIFGRRRKQGTDFIAVIEREGASGPERHAGRYGDLSYFGLSPRPHDLYLEEMWELDDDDDLRKTDPIQGGWFAASTIRDIRFRELPPDEKERGATRRFGFRSFEDALRDERRRIAGQIGEAVPALTSEHSLEELQSEFGRAVKRVANSIDSAKAEAIDVGEQYQRWQNVRHELLEFGAVAVGLVRREDPHNRTHDLRFLAEAGRRNLRVEMRDPKIWLAVFEAKAQEVLDATPARRLFSFDELFALVVDGVFEINNIDWDFGDPEYYEPAGEAT